MAESHRKKERKKEQHALPHTKTVNSCCWHSCFIVVPGEKRAKRAPASTATLRHAKLRTPSQPSPDVTNVLTSSPNYCGMASHQGSVVQCQTPPPPPQLKKTTTSTTNSNSALLLFVSSSGDKNLSDCPQILPTWYSISLNTVQYTWCLNTQESNQPDTVSVLTHKSPIHLMS